MLTTTWQPLVAGVDASQESLRAARLAIALADRAGVPCHLVHAVPELWSLPAAPHPFAGKPDELNREAAVASAEAVRASLTGGVPGDVLDQLEIRISRPALALADAAMDHHAGLIVVGGKHHTTLGRWMAGSTAHAVARTTPVPMLVATNDMVPHRRVLCAVDGSDAARPTIDQAVRWATLLDAALTVLHVIEPVPLFAEAPFAVTPDDQERQAEVMLARAAWPYVPADAERLVRHGHPETVIAEEVRRREADLVVLGTHGRGWFDRILIGSVTERVLGALPAPLLVVPCTGPVARRRKGAVLFREYAR